MIIARFVRIDDSSPAPIRSRTELDNDSNAKVSTTIIDIKGTLALTATIITFLAGITLFRVNSYYELYQVAGLFPASALSVTLFTTIERKVYSPLLDFKIMTNKSFLAPTIIIMLVFISDYMVYLTIPGMVRSPPPFGFGDNAIAVASIQLSFMIVLLIGTIMSGFILNKVNNTKLMLFGTALNVIGYFAVLIFHSTENMVSIELMIFATGLSFSMIGAFNVILVSVPMRMTGIALGMTLLLKLIGTSVGPTISGVFQKAFKGTAPGILGLFPTDQAYNLIFITAALVSLVSVVIAISMSSTRSRTPTITSEHLHNHVNNTSH